jgi:hypothetical protein
VRRLFRARRPGRHPHGLHGRAATAAERQPHPLCPLPGYAGGAPFPPPRLGRGDLRGRAGRPGRAHCLEARAARLPGGRRRRPGEPPTRRHRRGEKMARAPRQGWLPGTSEDLERIWAQRLLSFLHERLLAVGGIRLGRTGERISFALAEASVDLLAAEEARYPDSSVSRSASSSFGISRRKSGSPASAANAGGRGTSIPSLS